MNVGDVVKFLPNHAASTVGMIMEIHPLGSEHGYKVSWDGRPPIDAYYYDWELAGPTEVIGTALCL